VTAADSKSHGVIAVNKSTDDGDTWSAGAIVRVDDASDKEWLAVGPDPFNKNRDNVYVTWTSFQSTACQLRFGRSTDGGQTWTAKTIFVPTTDPNPTHPTNCLQFSNVVVDEITGSVYVPFLHFSNSDQDFIQVLRSDDAGETFKFLTFNVPGAPDATLLPVTQSGELTECGGNNFRLTIHGTANAGPGRFGLPRYINASRMVTQPAFAARNSVLYLAWSNSTSPFFGVAANSASGTLRVTSTSFDLPPSNIPLTGAPTFTATNFDRQIAVCYALGEYQSVATANGSVYAAWGDMRNLITEPVNSLDPISGQVHSQEDVFFQKVKAQ
jgi:hypothetical protein